jgi:hypothetical protein
VDFDWSQAIIKCLMIGVRTYKFHTAHAQVYHPIYGITASAAKSNNLENWLVSICRTKLIGKLERNIIQGNLASDDCDATIVPSPCDWLSRKPHVLCSSIHFFNSLATGKTLPSGLNQANWVYGLPALAESIHKLHARTSSGIGSG